MAVQFSVLRCCLCSNMFFGVKPSSLLTFRRTQVADPRNVINLRTSQVCHVYVGSVSGDESYVFRDPSETSLVPEALFHSLPPPISLFVLSLSVLMSLSLYLSLCVCLSLPPSSVSLERSTTIISAAETRQSTKLKSN